MAPSVLGSSSTAGGWVTTVRWRVRLRLSTTVLTSHLRTHGEYDSERISRSIHRF